MQLSFKYGHCKSFSRLYNYGLKHYPNYMITKEAEQRKKILLFWRDYGLKATKDAYGAKRSTLFSWWKKYKESRYKISSLNPGTQKKYHHRQKIYYNSD